MCHTCKCGQTLWTFLREKHVMLVDILITSSPAFVADGLQHLMINVEHKDSSGAGRIDRL